MELIVIPAGNGGVMLNDFVPAICAAVNATVGEIAVPTFPLIDCDDGATETSVAEAAETVIDTVAVAEDEPSDAVTVNVVADNETVGVPEITPVVELIVKPVGNEGVMLNVFVPVISIAVYAVVGVIAVPTATPTDCDAGEIEAAAETLDAVKGATRPTVTRRKTAAANDLILRFWNVITLSSSFDCCDYQL